MAAQHALVTLGSLMKMLLRQLLTTVTSYLLTNHICLIFSCSIRLQKVKSHFLGMLFRHHCCCSTLWQQELRRTNSCIGSGQLSCLPSSGCGLCPCRHCKQWFTWLIPFFFWCHRQRISSCILPPNMYAFASGWYWFWEGTNWERKRWKWCVLQGHMAIKRRNCRGK